MTPADVYRLRRAALALASRGYPVFPCVPDQKRPLTRHGLLDATTDIDTVRRWWQDHPTANIGIVTGTNSFDALDIDVRPSGNGFAALRELRRARLLEGHTYVVQTPSGGFHLYFAGTTQTSSSLPDRHIDFKASGGYVLVPPSVVDGRPYRHIVSFTIPAEPLDWQRVRELLGPPLSKQTAIVPARRPNQGIEPLAAWVARLPEGQRNQGTFWAACRAVEQGIADLRPILDAAITAGLPRDEATRTIGSAIRRTIHNPPAAPVVHRSPGVTRHPPRAAGA